MGERYWITGVQIGMIQAWLELKKLREIEKLLDEVQEKQFIGRIESEKESVVIKKEM